MPPHTSRSTVLAALAATAALAGSTSPPAAAASIGEHLQIADRAWASSPCAGHTTVTWQTDLKAALGIVDAGREVHGNATGIHTRPDGSWVRVSCEITLDPVAYRTLPAERQCSLVVHETGHLDMRGHAPSGVMAEFYGTYPPCLAARSLRVRVRSAIEARHPTAVVVCSPLQGRVMACRADVPGVGGGRAVRYRARARGNVFALRAIRSDLTLAPRSV